MNYQEKVTLLKIAGVYPHKKTKRGFCRAYGRETPIIVKRDEFKRDYSGNIWRIRHFVNDTKTYYRIMK